MNDICTFLNRHRPLWVNRPFTGLPVVWENEHPDLARALRSLDEALLDRFEDSPETLAPRLPAPFPSLAARATRLTDWPAWAAAEAPLPPRPRGIKARKWAQIVHFAAAVTGAGPRPPAWLEWCAGKGHLGRLLAARSRRPVTSIERDQVLCQAGEALAEAASVQQTFQPLDVLAGDAAPALHPDLGVVALHACGRLHTTLLLAAAQVRPELVALAPCCYQRHEDAPGPLSTNGRSHHPDLSASLLRLVSFDEAVASPAQRRQRRREQAYRLGVDLLLRKVRDQDSYQPLGPIPARWFKAPFGEFAARLFAERGWCLPATFDAARWESEGRERHRLTRALGLVRGLFRRPLESWLVLDRTLFLQEHGYQAEARTFCSREISPRNLLIIARRSC